MPPILVLNLALGGKTITTLQWLKDRKVIKSSKYEDKFCYDTICHWKSSGGEVFEKIVPMIFNFIQKETQ